MSRGAISVITAKIGSKMVRYAENLEDYFQMFRSHVIGNHQYFDSPYGKKKILYADWTSSGRLYRPIEQKITEMIGPYMANTHTESNVTSLKMNSLYNEAKKNHQRTCPCK